MSTDKFPWRLLIFRLLDVLLYFVAVFLLCALVAGYFAGTAKIGVIILVVGLYHEFRQQSFYSHDLNERDLLSSGLVKRPINAVAKVRARLSKSNILLIVLGTILSAWPVLSEP